MADFIGTAQGVDDSITGTRGDDTMQGLSGNDYLNGGRGDDVIIGGAGSDVLMGGLGADEFQWSAGHISDGATDYVMDFDIRQGDTFSFLDSASAEFEVLSISHTMVDDAEFNGYDLRNGDNSTDIVIEVYNATTNSTQKIVLLDSWSGGLNAQWEDYLATKGLSFSDGTMPSDDMMVA
ncbi:calcium-binding protein [Loktanella sp. M215]|uniref:calcium-binding protein n=1 Tax=Loktanella sp. M215 TaxID=2675431 RepID=UPI001FA69D8E|nr:hypothetical protein [Loktanella sp. M215]MCF7702203.1 hypothetical protein [Loktanella sp. M215]